jgi:hypothetical protein
MDLSAFIGQSVSLRFELLSDGAVERDGIYIDDVLVYYHDTTAVSSVRPVVRAEGAWQVWPNPANGQTAVYWSEQHDDGSLFLVDATGKTVRRWVVEKTQDRVPLALNGLPEGVYTVVFFSNSGTVETQRLVVGRR